MGVGRLDPTVLEGVIAAAVEPLIDREAWGEVEDREYEEKALLKQASDRWSEVAQFLGSEKE